MTAFDHVVLLLSFVYALAITHLLSRVGALILARDRVRFSGLHTLMMVNAITIVFSNWLSVWDTHGVREWDLLTILVQFGAAVTQYFICALAAPEAGEEGEIDLDAFFQHNRRPFYAACLLLLGFALPANAAFLKSPNPALFFEENGFVFAMSVPVLVGLFVPSRRAQWLAGASFFVSVAGLTAAFDYTLH